MAEKALDLLSAREREVMRLLARVLHKLQVSNRNELTRWSADPRIV